MPPTQFVRDIRTITQKPPPLHVTSNELPQFDFGSQTYTFKNPPVQLVMSVW